ncbi:TPA: hypothetical protein ACH3X2_012107 [Trebouxia sp. C0005]
MNWSSSGISVCSPLPSQRQSTTPNTYRQRQIGQGPQTLTWGDIGSWVETWGTGSFGWLRAVPPLCSYRDGTQSVLGTASSPTASSASAGRNNAKKGQMPKPQIEYHDLDDAPALWALASSA